MNVDFELYRIFYVVAKNLHMSKAADELYISQPAVSQAIKKLENQLNGTLFIRSNKGLTLTQEGTMFYNYIKVAIEAINKAENQFTYFKDLNVGQIKIGIPTTLTKLVLLESLELFHDKYPNINIDITNDLTSNLINMVNNGLLDFAILNEDDKEHPNLNIIKLKSIEHCFISNHKYIDLKDKILSLKEITKYPLILQKKESNTRQYLDSLALNNKIVLNPSLEVVSQDLVMEFTKIGLGIGFTIKDLIKNDLNDKNIFEIKIKELLDKKQIWLVTNKNTIPTFATKKFIDIIINNNK
jgi:DNA-binding transcriptional LysR family regulator